MIIHFLIHPWHSSGVCNMSASPRLFKTFSAWFVVQRPPSSLVWLPVASAQPQKGAQTVSLFCLVPTLLLFFLHNSGDHFNGPNQQIVTSGLGQFSDPCNPRKGLRKVSSFRPPAKHRFCGSRRGTRSPSTCSTRRGEDGERNLFQAR